MTLQLVSSETYTEPAPPSALECLVIVARSHRLHLTSDQLIKDNLLGAREVTSDQQIKCDENSAMRANGSRAIELTYCGGHA